MTIVASSICCAGPPRSADGRYPCTTKPSARCKRFRACGLMSSCSICVLAPVSRAGTSSPCWSVTLAPSGCRSSSARRPLMICSVARRTWNGVASGSCRNRSISTTSTVLSRRLPPLPRRGAWPAPRRFLAGALTGRDRDAELGAGRPVRDLNLDAAVDILAVQAVAVGHQPNTDTAGKDGSSDDQQRHDPAAHPHASGPESDGLLVHRGSVCPEPRHIKREFRLLCDRDNRPLPAGSGQIAEILREDLGVVVLRIAGGEEERQGGVDGALCQGPEMLRRLRRQLGTVGVAKRGPALGTVSEVTDHVRRRGQIAFPGIEGGRLATETARPVAIDQHAAAVVRRRIVVDALHTDGHEIV